MSATALRSARMRSLIIVAALGVLGSTPGASEVLYARPDASPAGAEYRWGNELVLDSIPLSAAIAIARGANGSRALEIRLLYAAAASETIYSVALDSFQSALRWHGSANAKLVIRGQLDRSAAPARPLTTVLGRSLTATICELDRINVCAAPSEEASPRERESRDGELQNLAEAFDRSAALDADRPARDVHFRLHCFLLWESSFVEFADLGFRDCWFAAVASYASSNIALRNSAIDGSTWAFLAVGKKARPETAHSFEVTGNVWRQSPASYRRPTVSCDIRRDWDCAVSIWSDLPWGIVHHHFWSPLNGALFMSRDVLGNVRVSNNYVSDAYNGIRATLSGACRADESCRQRTNNGFEISGNTFEHVRDNPVEPENHAALWIVKHNSFVNSYTGVSTDGVAGNDLLVFGNLFALEEAPGARCSDDGWLGSRQFLARRGGGRWSDVRAEEDDASCTSHRMGTVIKLGGDDDHPDRPLLRSILFFNNSLMTRSPLFRGFPSPPIISYNNAVEFVGCGTRGAVSCRQQPAPDASCAGKDWWTADGSSLVADCFSLQDGRGHTLRHRMRFNAYNREPGPKLGEIDGDRVSAPIAFDHALGAGKRDRATIERLFTPERTSRLAAAGCLLRYVGRDLACAGAGGPVGAFLPNGTWFDLELPFGSPFVAVLERAALP